MKAKMKLFLFLITIALLPFVLSACVYFSRHFTAYIKDNIKAVGGRTGVQDYAIFYNVCIGTQFGTQATNPATFSESIPKFAIKLADGTILTSDEMNYEKISSLPNVIGGSDQLQEKTYQTLFVDGYYFAFDNERKIVYFLTVSCLMNKKYNPMIGDIDGKQFYSFPINQEQLESIFGKADKYVNDYRL